ncbi:MAG: cobalamin-dependent protein [Deltaproteobacteria bacterium]|nr:cobalamin-dependent protein [Deltaproteobacteria bacterium]
MQQSIVFGTPKGDLHDLGKNIVITFMRANGFRIHDLGVDVPPSKFIDKIKETNANILAMSGLITPVFSSMISVIDLLRENGLRKKTFVIVGGPIMSELVVQKIGADVFGKDPVAGIKLCKDYLMRLQ